MMNNLRISPRFILSSLIFFTFLSLCTRSIYISIRGNDSLSMLAGTRSILDNGHIGWMINFMSFFGWTDFSYPSAEQTILASVTLMTGLNIIQTGYAFSLYLAVTAIFNMFIFSKIISGNNTLSILATAFFTTSSLLYTFTYNTVSARGLFLIFYPIVIYFALSTKDKFGNFSFRNFSLTVFSLLCLASIHRMILLFISLVVAPSLFTIIWSTLYSYLRKIDFMNNFLHRFFYLSIVGGLYLIVVTGHGFVDFNRLLQILPNTNLLYQTINLYYTYNQTWGYITIIVILGFFHLLFSSARFTRRHIFLLFSFMLLPLYIYDAGYTAAFYLPLACLFASYIIINNNFYEDRLFPLFSLFIILPSLVFMKWFIDKNSYFAVFFSLLVLVCLLYQCWPKAYDSSKSRKMVLSIFIIVICLNVSSTANLIRALNEANDINNSSNDINQEYRYLDDGVWLKYHSTGSFVSTEVDVENIASLLGLHDATTWFDIENNSLIVYQIRDSSLTFNLIEISKTKTLIELELDQINNVRLVHYSIFQTNNKAVIDLYRPDIVIISNSYYVSYEKGTEVYFALVYYLEDERYKIYSSAFSAYYHYNNY